MMFSFVALASATLLSLTRLATAFTCSSTNSSAGCAGGVHIIVARASSELQGFGIIGAVADNITKAIPASDAVAVVYPATLSFYFESETSGVTNMTKLVTDYVDKCPETRVVLMGYSQGANVVFDTLIGNGSTGGTDGLSSKYLNNIVAAIAMGDPTHVPGQSYDVGTSKRRGVFNRTNYEKINSEGLAPKIQSYCDFNDTFCDSGSSLPVHVGYTGVYGQQAVDFVVKKATEACGTANGSGTNSTTTANSTSPSSTASGASTATSGAVGSSTPAGTTSTGTSRPTATATSSAALSVFSALGVAHSPAIGTIGGLVLAMVWLL